MPAAAFSFAWRIELNAQNERQSASPVTSHGSFDFGGGGGGRMGTTVTSRAGGREAGPGVPPSSPRGAAVMPGNACAMAGMTRVEGAGAMEGAVGASVGATTREMSTMVLASWGFGSGGLIVGTR